jgi:uncharacterized membrane protein
MISNHYPMTYSHEYGWLVLVVISFIAAFARHFFNLRHQGITKPVILVAAAIMLAILAAAMVPAKIEAQKGEVLLNDIQAMSIIEQRCTSCHAQAPSNAGFASAPAGIVFETPAATLAFKDKMIPALQSGYMPLGNLTQMTDQERQQLLLWFTQ